MDIAHLEDHPAPDQPSDRDRCAGQDPGQHAGVSALRATASDVMAQAPKLISGVVQLTNALGQLNTAMPQLSSGAHELAEGLSAGVSQIPSLSENQQETLSSVMASPSSGGFDR